MSDRPRIPDEEFALRHARLREELAAAGMDAVIAYADQHATFGQQNARYLFDYQPHFEACLVVVPQEGDAFIATGPESDAFVQASSRCDTVRIIDAFCHPDEEYPHSAVERLGDWPVPQRLIEAFAPETAVPAATATCRAAAIVFFHDHPAATPPRASTTSP